MKRLWLVVNEKGQVLPMVVIGILVIIMMAALLLDGGVLFSNRRAAQAAADAGALAGARILCEDSISAGDVEFDATYYAISNGASNVTEVLLGYDRDGNSVFQLDPQPIINLDNRTIHVEVEIDSPSFFARVFGHNELVSGAQANAGCFDLKASSVLPIAWACRNPVDPQSDSPDCEVQILDWETELKPLITGNPDPVTIHNITDPVDTPMDFKRDFLGEYLYVFMDSDKTEDDLAYVCAEPNVTPLPAGTVDCDLDDDGVNDVFGHGDRSWLDLDGGLDSTEWKDVNGARALRDWVKGVNVPTTAIHTWLGGQTGVVTKIFQDVDDYVVGEVAVIPVFNAICDRYPDDACKAIAHAGEDDPKPTDYPVKVSAGANSYFHIIGFSAIYVTCVDDGSGSNTCPGARKFIDDNIAKLGWKPNTKLKSLEGYFVENYPFSTGEIGNGSASVGIRIVSLMP
jgi:hypothetical protein